MREIDERDVDVDERVVVEALQLLNRLVEGFASVAPLSIAVHAAARVDDEDAHKRLEQTRPLLVALGEELKIPVENLLTPDTLRRVCFEPAADIAAQLSELGARAWQVELTAGLIRAGFEKAESLPEA